MTKAMLPRTVAVILALAAAAILMLMASGTSRAAHPAVEGDLLLHAEVEVIDGNVDISRNGSIGNEDDGFAYGNIVVIDGKLDIAVPFGVVDGDDDGFFGVVIDGELDISGNLSIGTEDDGFIPDVGAVSVGTIVRQLCNVPVGSTVTIDVVAVDAEDWLGMDFVLYFPSETRVERPSPDDKDVDVHPLIDADAGFDFLIANPNVLNSDGSHNFLFPDSLTDANAVYSTSEGVPDGSSPHGISMFDGSITDSNSGSGGMARIKLNTLELAPGEYTLLLGRTVVFAGGIHSAIPPAPPPPFLPDNFGAFTLAIGVPCSTDSDGDGVSDADENTFGSDKNDADSIPENDDWIREFFGQPQANPGETKAGPTCSDGIDNDGDGQVDEADSGCGALAPPQTPTATVPSGVLQVSGEQPTPTATPTATVTPPLPATGGPPPGPSGSSWLIVLYVAGGVIAAMAVVGAISQRLKRRAAKAK